MVKRIQKFFKSWHFYILVLIMLSVLAYLVFLSYNRLDEIESSKMSIPDLFIILLPYISLPIFIFIVHYRYFLKRVDEYTNLPITILEKEYDYINLTIFNLGEFISKLTKGTVFIFIALFVFFFNYQHKYEEQFFIEKMKLEIVDKKNSNLETTKLFDNFKTDINNILNKDPFNELKRIFNNNIFIKLFLVICLVFIYVFIISQKSLFIYYKYKKALEKCLIKKSKEKSKGLFIKSYEKIKKALDESDKNK